MLPRLSLIAIAALLITALDGWAQDKPFYIWDVDTLENVTITGDAPKLLAYSRLRGVEGTVIYEGKKTEVVMVENTKGNKATNCARQMLGRVQGIQIWENDCGGLQLSIGGRGLSPNRSGNFNMRQNGYDISADNLGYPESYYTPPMLDISRVEVVRGAASLQYGTQFGGLVNFKMKEGPPNTPLQVKLNQSVGSFNFSNTHLSVGGTQGKLNYYAGYQYKRGDCWRNNSAYDAHNLYTSVNYQATENLKLGAEFTHSSYISQQAGGLTDRMFEQDPRQSIRDRNWMFINWNIINLTADYKLGNLTNLSLNSFMFTGGRGALGFLGRITRRDPALTPEQSPEHMLERDLLTDRYLNIGTEARLLHRYLIGQQYQAFSVGVRFFMGNTHRRQGNASAANGPDFNYLRPNRLEGSDFNFPSRNVALFAEHIFNLNQKLSITPGLRVEHIVTAADGYYNRRVRDLAGNVLLDSNFAETNYRARTFALPGLGVSYKHNYNTELYGNISANYRGVNFNDIRVVNESIQVDPKLQDEHGFTLDLGIRGKIKNKINYDATFFAIQYNQRIGLLPTKDTLTRRTFALRTNIGQARYAGLETYADMDVFKTKSLGNQPLVCNLFVNASLMHARYQSPDKSINGNWVEYVPHYILRTGLTNTYGPFVLGIQANYTGQQYSDATNAEFFTDATFGAIPAYAVWDLSLSFTHKNWQLEGNINNMFNHMYFTRRATGYPGPGIIPASGRGFFMSVIYTFNQKK